MENHQYIEKATDLLSKIDQHVEQNISFGRPKCFGIEGLIRDTRHLIYAFDKNLPLNQEIDKYYNCEIDDSSIEKIKIIVAFFVEYITDYYQR